MFSEEINLGTTMSPFVPNTYISRHENNMGKLYKLVVIH